MNGTIHSLIGAAAGSFFSRKDAAFLAGVASHLLADLLPHKDTDVPLDICLCTASLSAIASLRGVDSAEFAGAIGGIVPDSEHVLRIAGLLNDESLIFPTHIQKGKYHGPDTDEVFSQILLAISAILVILANGHEKKEDCAEEEVECDEALKVG